MAVTEIEKTARPRRAVQVAGRLGALRTALTAWLGRPLASFHLVLAVFALLTALGLVMVLSASVVVSFNTPGFGLYTVFKKQLLYVLVGSVLFWVGLRLPLPTIRALSPIGMMIGVIILVAVLTPLGAKVNGTRSWFVVGPISFQPIEVCKLALALWGAHVLVVKRAVLHRYRHLLVPVLPVALLLFALVMLQPDLGGTITLGVVLIALLWFAGAPLRLFGALALGGLAGVALLAVGTQYRLDRVVSFLSPDDDLGGKNYQAVQAQLALADGGFFGRGLGQGSSKWHFLPNVHNDFIFALIGDELGLLGCGLVLALFVMVAVIGMRIATRNIDPWIRMVAATLTVWLVAQAAINIGYVVGLLPVTGITLPLISSGGTSVVVTMLVFGILGNCARHEPEAVSALRSQGPGRFGKLLHLPAPDPYQPPKKRKPVRPTAPPRGAEQRRRGTPERARQKASRGNPRTAKGGRR
ncbi:cell division-specific peptidoglycan biosynthesis regulator FtsW [Actinokineospora alba]|uniref:Probable peptidoglycan glycosyltransferase FtsW n=1 Tax=Actinokineospora alba TaxID=504798 RepID=A0A1H0MPZ9_9PSEU|nr:putative lipid II flippase FtsW [Actinokineospora alba]TDP68389.1 cell division-specific peptidoglycan biosynthesis regulator FtsW [Actinokineospora alba]SDH78007.1 cell division protein FtsW [Actinokineospora alba]SDO82492.1 cell division-specific peptidoglycan biosynthesis regulator FtsW [Actinokineospora alba]